MKQVRTGVAPGVWVRVAPGKVEVHEVYKLKVYLEIIFLLFLQAFQRNTSIFIKANFS